MGIECCSLRALHTPHNCELQTILTHGIPRFRHPKTCRYWQIISSWRSGTFRIQRICIYMESIRHALAPIRFFLRFYSVLLLASGLYKSCKNRGKDTKVGVTSPFLMHLLFEERASQSRQLVSCKPIYVRWSRQIFMWDCEVDQMTLGGGFYKWQMRIREIQYSL